MSERFHKIRAQVSMSMLVMGTAVVMFTAISALVGVVYSNLTKTDQVATAEITVLQGQEVAHQQEQTIVAANLYIICSALKQKCIPMPGTGNSTNP